MSRHRRQQESGEAHLLPILLSLLGLGLAGPTVVLHEQVADFVKSVSPVVALDIEPPHR